MKNKTYHEFIKIWLINVHVDTVKECDRFMKQVYKPHSYKKIRYLFLFKPKMEMLSILKKNNNYNTIEEYNHNYNTIEEYNRNIIIIEAVKFILDVE